MMGFDYEVLYKKKVSNGAADALSRKPQAEFYAITTLQTDLLDRIQLTWTTNSTLVQLIAQLQQGVLATSKYTWQHNQLRRRGKLVVGNDSVLRTELLQYFHNLVDGGHSGAQAMMAHIGTVLY